MSAKQNRPIGQYMEQFEDVTPEPMFEQDEFDKRIAEDQAAYKAQKGINTDTDPEEKTFDEKIQEEQDAYRARKADKSGYRTLKYMRDLRSAISRADGLSTPGFEPTPENTIDLQQDYLIKSKGRLIWNSLQKAIDEIQISSSKGEVLENTFKIENLQDAAKNEGRALTKDEEEEIAEYRKNIEELEKDIEENEAELAADKEYLGPYFQAQIERDKEIPGVLPDSWMELADGLGGSMSEIGALAATVGIRYGSAALAGAVSGGAGASWSGPGIVAGVIIGAGVGMSLMAQNYARSRESYAEMEEAYSSYIEAEKRKYRLANNGKEMPADELRALEKDARRDVKSVYDHNMNLFATDMLEVGLAYAIPWSKLKDIGGVGNKFLKYGARTGMALGGGAVGALWEGREEGDQFLIKNNFIRGDYDNYDMNRMQTLFSSMGIASETIAGMGINAYNRAFDHRASGGRTGSKEFKAAVNSGIMIGAFMGGGQTAVSTALSKSAKALDNIRYGEEAEDLKNQLYDRVYGAEQNKAASEWLYNKLKEPDAVKRLMKITRKIKSSMPDLADKMENINDLYTMLQRAEKYHAVSQGKNLGDMNDKERMGLFRAFMALDHKEQGLIKDLASSQEAYDELVAAMPIPEGKDEQGLPELQVAKAKLLAAQEALDALNKEKVKNPWHSQYNKLQRSIFNNMLRDQVVDEETTEGLETEYNKLLEQYDKQDADVIVEDSLKEATKALMNNQASLGATRGSMKMLQINSLGNKERVLNDAFYQDFNEVLAKPKKEKEKTVVPSLDQQIEDEDLVQVVDSETGKPRNVLAVTEEDEEGNFTIRYIDPKTEEDVYPVEGSEMVKVEEEEKIKEDLKRTKGKQDNKNQKGRNQKKKEEKKKKTKKKASDQGEQLELNLEPQEEPQPVTEEESETDGSVETGFDENTNPTPTESQEEEESKPEEAKEPEQEENTPEFTNSANPKGALFFPRTLGNPEYIQNLKAKLLQNIYKLFRVKEQSQNKARMKARFFLNEEYVAKLPKGLREKIANKEALQDHEIDQLPIQVKIDGLEQEDLVSVLYKTDKGQPDVENQSIIRKKIYEAYVNNQDLFYTIEIETNVYKENTVEGGKFSVLSLFTEGEPVIGYNQGGGTITDGDVVLGQLTNPNVPAGRLYAMVEVPLTGYMFPVKLNQRGLNDTEIDTLVQVLRAIQSNGKNVKFEDSNLTNKDYLNFLVNSYSNQQNAKDSKIRLIVPGKGKKITYGEQDAVLDFNSEQDIARFKEWAKQNLKRHVSKELLKTNRLGKDFTFLGVDYSKSDSYIDFLTGKDQTNTDNHVLLTDVKLDETGSPVTFYPPGYDIQFQTDVNSETVEGEQSAKVSTKDKELTVEEISKQLKDLNITSKPIGELLSLFEGLLKGIGQTGSSVSIGVLGTSALPGIYTYDNTYNAILENITEENVYDDFVDAVAENGGKIFYEIFTDKQRAEKPVITPENGKPAQGTNNTDSATTDLADEAFDDKELGEEGENTAENFDLTMTVGQMPTVEDKNTERIDRKKAERNFRKIVGKLIPLEFQKSLIRIAGSNIFAYGLFRQAGVILSDQAPAGAEYHEAYHVVEELWLPGEQRAQLDAETKREYGAAPKSEIDKIVAKYKQEGFDITDDIAESIYYSELRAEDYRVYARTGETLGIVGKTLRWFKRLKDGLNYLFNPKTGFTTDLFFARMSAGFYAKRQPLSASVALWKRNKGVFAMAMQKMGITARTINQTVDHLLAVFVQMPVEAGGLGGVMNINNVSELSKMNMQTFISYLKGQIKKRRAEGNEEQAAMLEAILGTEENKYTDGLLPELKTNLSIRLAQIGIREREQDERANADLHAATKDAFESSGKDNANTNTKFLFNFLRKFDEQGNLVVNPQTGLAVIESPSRVYNTVEKVLSGLVTYKDAQGNTIFAYDRMMSSLKMLAEADKTFETLYQNVADKLSDNERTQFFNTFSKSSNNFLTAIASEFSFTDRDGIPQTKINFRFIDPSQFSKKFRIRERWLDLYQDSKLFKRTVTKEGKEVFTANSTLAKDLAAKWDVFTGIIAKQKGELTVAHYNQIKRFLSNFGIEVTVEGLQIATQGYINEQTAKAKGRKINFKAAGVAAMMTDIGRLVDGSQEYHLTTIAGRNNDNISIDLQDNNSIKGEKVVLKLAEAEAFFGDDYDQTTILRSEGKKVWIYSLNNYFKKKSLEFAQSNFYVNQMLSVPFHKGSLLLEHLQNRGLFKYRTFNVFNNKMGNNSITEYKNITEADEYLLRFNMTLDNIYSPPTMADKSVWMVYQGPDYITRDMIRQIMYNKETDTYTFPTEILDVFMDYAIADVARMRQARLQLFGTDNLSGKLTDKNKISDPWEDNELVEFYHYTETDDNNKPIRNTARALQSDHFDFLNDEEFLKEVGILINNNFIEPSVKDLKANQAFIDKISEALNERVKTETQAALDFTVAKLNDAGDIRLDQVPQEFKLQAENSKGYRAEGDNLDMVSRRLISAFTLNSTVSGIEVMKAFAGDSTFYKSMDDFQKRLPELIAPGQDLNLRNQEDLNFNAAVLRDDEQASEFYEEYLEAYKRLNKELELGYTEEEIKTILEPYESVNRTDAQGYITLDRWKFLMQKLGKWNQNGKELDQAYDRLKKGVATSDDMKLVAAMPLKGMYFGLRSYKGLMVPTYFKYSQAVLFPQMVAGTEELQALYDAMTNEAKPVDEVVFESGVKVGAQSPIVRSEDGTFNFNNVMSLENNNWKLQQELEPHTSPTQLEGSQIKRNILANIKMDQEYTLDGKKIKGRDLVQQAHNIDRELSDIGKQELLDEMGIVETDNSFVITDYKKLQKILLKSFAKEKGTTKKLIESLELSADGKSFKRPLHRHPYADKISQMIGSIITKRTVKLEMPGGSYVQMSGYGTQRVSKYSDLSNKQKKKVDLIVNPEKLKPAIYENGKRVRAQILLPYYFKELIEGMTDANKMSAKQINKVIKDKRLLRGVAYRIPNQGMSSIDGFDIVGFLPKSMGDTVIAYDDITAKSGSDFDIDKMYIMLPSYTMRDGKPEYVAYVEGREWKSQEAKKKALRNRKLEIYDAILQDDKTYIELITPLDSIGTKFRAAVVRFKENKTKFSTEETQQLSNLRANKEYSKYIKLVNSVMNKRKTLEWFSPSYQLKVKQSFIGGKFGVGQEARPLVDHPLSQFDELELTKGLGFESTSLGRIYNDAKGLITNVMSGRLNAYVDIAKDPYIFYINNNSITANTVALLDRLGVDPAWNDFFMSQPILKDFVANSYYNNSDSTDKVMKDGKMMSAEALTLEKYKKLLADSLLDETNGDAQAAETLAVDFIRKTEKKFKADNALITEVLPVSYLEEMLEGNFTKDDIKNQIIIYFNFKEFKKTATALNKLVSASKQDVEGAGGGMVNVIVSNKRLQKALQDNTFTNPGARFQGTMLEKYIENSVNLMEKAFSDQFNIASPGFKVALHKIAAALNQDRMFDDPVMLRKVYKALYTVYLSKKIEGFTSAKANELLLSDNNIFNRFEYWQKAEASPIKDNALIAQLVLKRATKPGDIGQIKFFSGEMDAVDMDKLSEKWEELLAHENKDVRQFAEDLAYYTFLVDGIGTSAFGFSSLVPLSMEDKMFQTLDMEAYLIDNPDAVGQKMPDFNSEELFSNEDIATVIKNNFNTPGFIFKIGKNTIKDTVLIGSKGTPSAGVTLAFATGDTRIQREEGNLITYPDYVQYKNNLYELVGLSKVNKNPVYILTDKKGKHEGGVSIFEPFSGDSIIPGNTPRFTLSSKKAFQDKVIAAISMDKTDEELSELSKSDIKNLEKKKFLYKNFRQESQSEQESGIDSEDLPGDVFAHLESTLEQEAREQARLAKGASGITEVYSGSTLSKSTVRRLKENGYTNRDVKNFEDYLKANHGAFRGKRIDVLATYRFDEFLQAHRDIAKELALLTEEANTELDNFLIEYLSEFGVEINELTIDEMENKYGIGRIGIADTIKKIIDVSKDRNVLVMPEEFSHMLIDLVGANSAVMKPLMDNIINWGKYASVVEEYKNDPLYQNEDGSLNINKIKKEAAGKLLAESIVFANNRKEPKGFFLKVAYDVYNAILDIFSKADKTMPVEAIANQIADKVLAGDKTLLDNYERARENNFIVRGYEESIAAFPKAAKALEQIIVNLKGKLTGSLAMRAQGIVMRPETEAIHDLDFKLLKSDRYFKNRIEVWEWLRNEVPTVVDNFIPIYVWDNKSDKDQYTVNGVITEYPYIAEKFKNLKGNFNSRMDQMTEFERDNMILIDFFINSPEFESTEMGHVTWSSIFEAKLGQNTGLTRPKDYYDIQKFMPFEEYKKQILPMQSTEFVYANISRGKIFEMAYNEIEKATTKKGPLRRYYKATFAKKNRYAEASKLIQNINDTVFNGGQVLKFVQNPNGPIGQMKLSIRPDEYIPAQLSLFNTEPFSTKCD